MKDGQSGKIVAIQLGANYENRLFYLGIIQGARVEKICTAPMGDPFLFRIKGILISIRKAHCYAIEVEVEL